MGEICFRMVVSDKARLTHMPNVIKMWAKNTLNEVDQRQGPPHLTSPGEPNG